MATVEQEQIHKKRIGITVDGKKINKDTWYANGTSYPPLCDVAEILEAKVNYNSSTMSAYIKRDVAPDNIIGVYKGTYINNSGIMGLTLTIKSEKAYFEFYPTAGSQGDNKYATGKYEVNYKYDKENGFIQLNQKNWIENPNGYIMVDIMSGVNDGYLNGSIFNGNDHFGKVTVKKYNNESLKKEINL